MSRYLDPITTRIIVKKSSEEETKSGIIRPTEVRKRSLEGIVISAGPDCVVVKAGDSILFAQFSGTAFKPYMDDELCNKYEDCVIMNEEDILCYVRDTEPGASYNGNMDGSSMVQSGQR